MKTILKYYYWVFYSIYYFNICFSNFIGDHTYSFLIHMLRSKYGRKIAEFFGMDVDKRIEILINKNLPWAKRCCESIAFLDTPGDIAGLLIGLNFAVMFNISNLLNYPILHLINNDIKVIFYPSIIYMLYICVSNDERTKKFIKIAARQKKRKA